MLKAAWFASSVSTRTSVSHSLRIHESGLPLLVYLLFNLFNPDLHPPPPPRLCQCLIRFTPLFPFLHSILPSFLSNHRFLSPLSMCHVQGTLIFSSGSWLGYSGFYVYERKHNQTAGMESAQATESYSTEHGLDRVAVVFMTCKTVFLGRWSIGIHLPCWSSVIRSCSPPAPGLRLTLSCGLPGGG